jgi:hypothetical protein
MGAVADLCTRAILLKNGQLLLDGPTETIIRSYVQQNMQVSLNDEQALSNSENRRGTGEVRFEDISMFNKQGKKCNEFIPGDDILISMRAKVLKDVNNLQCSIGFRSGRTRDLITTTGRNKIKDGQFKAGEEITLNYSLPKVLFRPGVYETYFWLGDNRADVAIDVVDNLLAPLVIQIPPDDSSIYQNGYFSIPFQVEIST